MKADLLSVVCAIALLAVVCLPANGATYQYEVGVQAQTSLDIGPIELNGYIRNLSNIPLDLSPVGTSISGLPSNLNETTGWCGLGDATTCLYYQLNGNVLEPGNTFSFFWLKGAQEEELLGYSGAFFSGLIYLFPLNASTATVAGSPYVYSEWVNGPSDASLPFDANIYTGTYVSSVPIPPALYLFGSGLIGLVGMTRRKVS